MRVISRDAHRLFREEVAGVGASERLDEGAEVERGAVVAVLRAEDEDRPRSPSAKSGWRCTDWISIFSDRSSSDCVCGRKEFFPVVPLVT